MPTHCVSGKSGIRLVADVERQDCRPTVLFLHAGGENRTVWRPIAPAVEALGWRTVTMDLRGHGDSDRAPSYRLDDFVDDVVTVVARFCGRHLVIVGGSIGGILGAIVEGERRICVDGLVLLDTPTRLPSMEGPRSEVHKIASAQARGAEAVASVDPKFLDSTFLEDIGHDRDRLRRATRRLEIPVLIIGGERSRYRTHVAETAAREDIRHVEIAYVPGGHLVARDCPADVSRLIVGFLQRSWSRTLPTDVPSG
ncbi:MAG: alpha/beta fold hydrolase [Steroidobacteraceae bacterium]